MCSAIASNSLDVKSLNLVNNHAYSLLNVCTLRLNNGKTQRLLQVRNPWGSKEWIGKWCDSDPDWEKYKN